MSEHESGSVNHRKRPAEVVDLTADSPVASDDGGGATGPPAAATRARKKQKKGKRDEIQNPSETTASSVLDLFEKYLQAPEDDDAYRPRFIQEETPDDEWLGWLRQDVSYVVVPVSQSGKKAGKVVLACQKLAIPCSRVDDAGFARILPDQRTYLAVCLKVVRNDEDSKALESHRADALAETFKEMAWEECDGNIKQLIASFCTNLVKSSGYKNPTSFKESPCVIGKRSRQKVAEGSARVVLLDRLGFKASSEEIGVVQTCCRKQIPVVWYPSKKRVGTVLGTPSVAWACIISVDDKTTANSVASLVNSIREQIKADDIARLSACGLESPGATVERIYAAAGLPPPPPPPNAEKPPAPPPPSTVASKNLVLGDKAAAQSALPKMKLKKINKGMKGICAKYKNFTSEQTRAYHLRFIFENSDEDWLGWFKETASCVLVQNETTSPEVRKILFAARKYGLPFFPNMHAHELDSLRGETGPDSGRDDGAVIAVCLTGIKPGDLNAFNGLKDAFILHLLSGPDRQDGTRLRPLVKSFCERLRAATGTDNLYSLELSPIAHGDVECFQIPSVVLASPPSITEDSFVLLKRCVEENVPIVWYKKNELDKLFRADASGLTSIFLSKHSVYGERVQRLIDAVQRVIQEEDIKFVESKRTPPSAVREFVERVYESVGLKFFPASSNDQEGLGASFPGTTTGSGSDVSLELGVAGAEGGSVTTVGMGSGPRVVQGGRSVPTRDAQVTLTDVASNQLVQRRKLELVRQDVFRFFSNYTTERSGAYQLRFICQNDDDWLGWFKVQTSCVLLSRHNWKAKRRILLAARKFGLPFMDVSKANLLKKMVKKTGLEAQEHRGPVAAICLTGIKPEDVKSFGSLKDEIFLHRLIRSYSKNASRFKPLVASFCERLRAATGVEDLSNLEDSPFVDGRVERQGTPCIVLALYKCIEDSFALLKCFYERSVPFVWYKDQNELDGLPAASSGVTCIFPSDHPAYGKHVQQLIVSIQHMVQENNVKSVEESSGNTPSAEAREFVEKVYKSAGLSFLSLTSSQQDRTESIGYTAGIGVVAGNAGDDRATLAGAENVLGSINITMPAPVAPSAPGSNFPTTTDEETIRLEERIIALESAVQLTRSRRHDVEEQEKETITLIEDSGDRLARLLAQRDELGFTLKKQTKLQQELQSSLEKSQYQLRRLMSPDAEFTPGEMALLAEPDEPEQTYDCMEVDSSAGLLVPEQEALTTSGDDTDLGMIESDRMRLVWIGGKEQSCRIGLFLPPLATKDLLLSILRVAVCEVLVTDSSKDGWRHRREAMWNTCLDARMLVPWQAGVDEVDEGSDVQASARVIVDPNLQLCPYELAGECHDEFCAYQHLHERPFGRIVPRELLPLPKLFLSPTPVTKKGALKSMASEPSHGGEMHVLEQLQSPELKAPELDSLPEESDEDELAGNLDYVALPPPDAGEEILTDDDAKRDEGGIEMEAALSVLEKQLSSECSRGIWISRKMMEAFFSDSEISVSLLLRSMKCLVYGPTGAVESNEVEPAIGLQGAFGVIGKASTCVCIALHAGRFETARAITAAALRWSESCDENESDRRIFSSMLRYLQSLESRALAVEAAPVKGIFSNSFSVQCRGTILSYFAYTLGHIDDSTEMKHNIVQIWEHVAGEVMESHVADAGGEVAALNERELINNIKTSVFAYDEQTLVGGGDDRLAAARQYIQSLVDAIRKGREVRKRVACTERLRFLVDKVIPLSLHLFEEAMKAVVGDERDSVGVLFRCSLSLLFILLGSIENAAARLHLDKTVQSPVGVECLDLYSAVDKALQSLWNVASRCPVLSLLVCPISAANVSLASTLKSYNKAQSRLQSLIACRAGAPSISALSELLWSQLIQLEALLPTRSDGQTDAVADETSRVPPTVPSVLSERHAVIADQVTAREVHPRHVTLANDWLLTHYLSNETDENLLASCQNIIKVPPFVPQKTPPTEFTLKDRTLTRRGTRGTPSTVYHKIPQSLLLVGPSLRSLVLANVGLDKLPLHFGSYFNGLEVLDLSKNDLSQVPESILKITTLQHLRLNKNKLVSLPSSADLPHLILFDASDNNLSELPLDFAKCTHLRELHLAGNPIGTSVWELASSLPELLTFSYDDASRNTSSGVL